MQNGASDMVQLREDYLESTLPVRYAGDNCPIDVTKRSYFDTAS